ncbi:MAG: hypothetical protein QM564_02750 [Bergeyella sp.]
MIKFIKEFLIFGAVTALLYVINAVTASFIPDNWRLLLYNNAAVYLLTAIILLVASFNYFELKNSGFKYILRYSFANFLITIVVNFINSLKYKFEIVGLCDSKPINTELFLASVYISGFLIFFSVFIFLLSFIKSKIQIFDKNTMTFTVVTIFFILIHDNNKLLSLLFS